MQARVEQAALDLFTERGFDAVTADEVTDAAGISRRKRRRPGHQPQSM